MEFQRTQFWIRDKSTRASVPNDDRARLMYYLKCVNNLLELGDDATMQRLTNYRRYFLSEEELKKPIVLCYLFSPDVLIGQCMFHDDDLCGDMNNKFYELSATTTTLAVASSIVIGGQRRRVTSFMTFKMTWLEQNWALPLQRICEEQRRKEERRRQQEMAFSRQTSEACTII